MKKRAIYKIPYRENSLRLRNVHMKHDEQLLRLTLAHSYLYASTGNVQKIFHGPISYNSIFFVRPRMRHLLIIHSETPAFLESSLRKIKLQHQRTWQWRCYFLGRWGTSSSMCSPRRSLAQECNAVRSLARDCMIIDYKPTARLMLDAGFRFDSRATSVTALGCCGREGITGCPD